VAAALTTHPI